MEYMPRRDNFTGVHWKEEINTPLNYVSRDLRSTMNIIDGYYHGKKLFNMDMIV